MFSNMEIEVEGEDIDESEIDKMEEDVQLIVNKDFIEYSNLNNEIYQWWQVRVSELEEN